MAICTACNQEMQTANGCTELLVNVNNKPNARVFYGAEQGAYAWKHDRCHDCGAKWNHQHHPGCDMEECPWCHGQLISCACIIQ